MYCMRCNYPLDRQSGRCAECGVPFDPAEPSTFRATPDPGPSRPLPCLLLAMAVSAIVTLAGHGVTVAWPALSGRMTGLVTLIAIALAVGAFSLHRRRLAEAVAIASGAALGPVVVFVLASWLMSGGIFMPAGWLLLLPLVLLSAFVPTALVAAWIGRWLRRNGP